MERRQQNTKGFTLIELLVVIAIIGVLATIVLSSLRSARTKAMDAKRASAIKQIQNALEMYNIDHGGYPHCNYVHTYHNGNQKSCLENALSPYMALDLDDKIFGPYMQNGDTLFRFSSKPADNYQTYGMSIRFIDKSYNHFEQNDGGHYSYVYEVGQRPKYCEDKYHSGWFISGGNLCIGGN